MLFERFRTPRTDERALWDVLFGVWGYPAVLVANQLKLFELLAEKPLTVEEVCRSKNIAKRPAETLLSVCTSLEFVRLKDGRYSLTPIPRTIWCRQAPPTSAGFSKRGRLFTPCGR